MIKAVLFDLDGVLIDSEIRTLRIKKAMFEEYGLDLGEDIFNILAGSALFRIFKEIFPDYPNPDEFLEEYHKRAYVDVKVDYGKMMMTNATKLLTDLKKKGYLVGLVTAADKKKIRQVIDECGWNNIFETIVSGEDGYPKKPDSTVYKVAMQRLNVTAAETIILEDSTTGLKSARGSGATVVCRKEERYSVDQSDADYYIGMDLLQLEEILEEKAHE